jgi:hypothetical protein
VVASILEVLDFLYFFLLFSSRIFKI